MLVKEPLSIGGVIDAGVSFFRTSFKQSLPTAFVGAIPYAAISAVMSMQSAGLETQTDPDMVLAQASQALALLPFLYATISFAMIAIIHRQVSIINDQATSIGQDLMCAVKMFIPLTILMFLFILIFGIGLMLLIIPGTILGVSMSLFLYVPFMEDRSPWSGLTRSHALIWGGNWWRTAIILTVISVIGMVLSAVFYLGTGALVVIEAGQPVGTGYYVVEALLTWIMIALYLPLTSAMFIALYSDLLLRKEGGDLDARLDSLEEPA